MLTTELLCPKELNAATGSLPKNRANRDGNVTCPSLASCRPYRVPLLRQPSVAREEGTSPLDRCPHHCTGFSPSVQLGRAFTSLPTFQPTPSSGTHTTSHLLVKQAEGIRQKLPACYPHLPTSWSCGLLQGAGHTGDKNLLSSAPRSHTPHPNGHVVPWIPFQNILTVSPPLPITYL